MAVLNIHLYVVHIHFLSGIFILFVVLSDCVRAILSSLWQTCIYDTTSGFCPIQTYGLPKPTEILLLSMESHIKSTGLAYC